MKILNKAYYTIKRSNTGLGLFATKDIPKKICIIEYIGPLITQEQANKKGGKYLFEISKTHTIDGSVRKNTARYINHSCSPNSEVEVKNTRVFIYSKKKIPMGEEITYDYGKEFFNEYIKPKGCLCKKCR